MTNQPVYKYFAFISYSRKDEAFAKKLQHFLTRFKLPSRLCKKYPDKPTNLRPIYRDKTDLIIDKLNDGITSGLLVSKYLIVICSEHSARPNEDGKNWVDEEVRFFAGLRPENEHRIIPVLLKRRKGLSVKNCMPPAIKELDILAADIQDKGESRVFSDVVAKMLELTPDELWNWVEREERKKRVFRRIGAGLAAVLAVASGIFAWDYNREKVDYYAYWAERDNYPVGIIKLDKEQVQGREFHYRFVSRGYKVRRVEMCNGHGNPIDAPYYTYLPESVAITEYMDFVDGKPRKSVCRAAGGTVQVIKRYPDANTITYHLPGKNEEPGDKQSLMPVWTHELETSLRKDSVFTSRITRCHVTRKDGWIEREMFLNGDGRPRRNPDGAWGRLLERDALGRIECVTYLDKKGEPCGARMNVCSMRMKYTDKHEVEEVRICDVNGNLAEADDGVALIRYIRCGNIQEVQSFDCSEQPVISRDASVQCAKQVAEVTPYGLAKSLRAFNVEGDVVPMGDSGAYAVEMDYDDRGHISEIRYLDAGGKLMLNKSGVAITKFKHENNRLVRVEYLGLNRERVLHQVDKIAISEMDYDDNGNVREQRFYGIDEKLCLNVYGYARIRYTLDEYGELVAGEFYGTDGKTPCLSVYGYASMTREIEWDGTRRTVTESHFGTDGELCLNWRGVARMRIHTSEEGNKSYQKMIFYGLQDEAIADKDGVAAILQEYDEHGLEVRLEFLGLDGQLVARKGAFSRIITEYDDKGNIVRQSTYNEKGEAWSDEDGCVRYEHQYYIDGKPHMEEGFDAQGRRLFSRLKHTDVGLISVSLYNPQGKQRRFEWRDSAGKLSVHPRVGIAGYESIFDKRGNEIACVFFNAEEKPVMQSGGYAAWIREYDEHNREISCVYLNQDFKRCLRPYGYAAYKNQYDEKGNLTLVEFLGLDGKRLLQPEGYAAVKKKYDEKGNQIQMEFLDTEDNLVKLADGYAAVHSSYDEQGRLLEDVALDEMLNPCLMKWGHAKTRYTYGEGHVQIENLDLENRTVDSSLGYAYQDIVLDAHGNYASITYRNAAGESVSLSDGTFRKVYVYDKDGKKRRHAEFYDKEGKLLRREFE